MDYNFFINSLDQSAKKVSALLETVTVEQAKWKPLPEKWSILEVVNHLYDEEREDFRKRLDLTLHLPEKEWPGIDPEKWAIDRSYNAREYSQSLNNFLNERKKSLEWLRSLSAPNWEQVYHHPIIGDLSAADLLAAWAAHDYLHLRQLSDLQVRYLDVKASPHSIRYASP
jgi:hypothetical protein